MTAAYLDECDRCGEPSDELTTVEIEAPSMDGPGDAESLCPSCISDDEESIVDSYLANRPWSP